MSTHPTPSRPIVSDPQEVDTDTHVIHTLDRDALGAEQISEDPERDDERSAPEAPPLNRRR